MTSFNKEIIILKEMQYGEIMFTIIEILFISTGIYLFARWIGQLGVLELLGRNWYMLFLCSDTFFLLSAADIIGNDIFNAFKNNFLTAFIRLICYLILLTAIMLIWETHIKKVLDKKVLDKKVLDKKGKDKKQR